MNGSFTARTNVSHQTVPTVMWKYPSAHGLYGGGTLMPCTDASRTIFSPVYSYAVSETARRSMELVNVSIIETSIQSPWPVTSRPSTAAIVATAAVWPPKCRLTRGAIDIGSPSGWPVPNISWPIP
jgi:hypothetical protein